MADRRLVVAIIGDDSALQKSLNRAAANTAKFQDKVGKTMRVPVSSADAFGPLLEKTRAMRGEADALGGRLDDLDKSFGRTGAGATGLGSGLGALTLRAGAVGFALSATYQASQRLQDALKATGQEAFTTEGKIRNFTAALINADIIGGIEALRAAPKTLEDAGISASFAEQHYEAFRRVAKGVGDTNSATTKSLQDFDDAAKEAGTSSGALANQALALADATRIATTAQDALNFSLRETNVLASGLQVAFKPRPEEGRAAREAAQGAPGPTSGKLFTPIGPTAKNLAAQTIAAATGDLEELLKLQTVARDRLAKALAQSTGNVKQREALNQSLAVANAAIIGTQQQIKAAGDAATKSANEAKKARISEHWGKIIASLSLNLGRAELTPQLNDDLTGLKKLEAGLRAQIKAGVDVVAAQTQLVTVTGNIAAKQAEIRANTQTELQKRQFRALGLTGAGDQPIPGLPNLKKQFAQLTARTDFSDLSPKMEAAVARAGKVLSGAFGKVTDQTREAAAGIFDAARDELNKQSTKGLQLRGAQLSDKLLDALGLSQDPDVKKLQRLVPATPRITTAAGTPAAGGGGINFNAPITVVADDPDAFLRELQKKAGRTTATSRGRFPGRSLGLG